MLDAIARVITSPAGFFSDLGENKKIPGAIWVVLLTTLISAVTAYFLSAPQSDAFGADSAFTGIGLIIGVGGVVIVSLISWLLLGLIVRMSAGMDAKPWAVVGYSFVPQLLVSIIAIVIAALFPIEVTPITVTPSEPEAFQEALRSLTEEIQSSVLGRSNQFLGYLATAWGVLLIFIGVRETTQNQARATRSAVIVGLIYAAIFLLPWLLATPVA